jgi:hypothetical protein
MMVPFWEPQQNQRSREKALPGGQAALRWITDHFSSPPSAARSWRIWQAWEQYWRSLRPALRRNQRPHFGAGHLAHVIMPAISSANLCQMASMSLAGR